MKSQDVKKLKKSVIEKSISSIWSSKKKQKAEKEGEAASRYDCLNISSRRLQKISESNTNNSNCRKYINKSDISLSASSIESSTKSCSCSDACENCKCELLAACRSACSSNSFNSRKLPVQSIRFEGDEIILYTNKTAEVKSGRSSSRQHNEDDINKADLKPPTLQQKMTLLKAARVLQKTVLLVPRLMLLFASFIPNVLYYGRQPVLYIHKFKRFLTVLFIFSSFYISAYFNYFCIFPSIMKQIVYSRNDAFAKIMNSEGVPCDESLHLYFVQTLKNGLMQVEVAPDFCSPIRNCFKVDYSIAEKDVNIIRSTRDDDLMSECSKIAIDEQPNDEYSDCKGSESFVKDINELSKHETINDYMLIEVIKEKIFCKFDSEEDVLKCPFNDKRISKCFDRHHSCKPKIQSKTVKFNVNNQKLFDISHCYCDREFYKCLKGVSNPFANLIGRIYFNNLGLKCFHLEYKHNCKLYILGSCLKNGEPYCQANLKENPSF